MEADIREYDTVSSTNIILSEMAEGGAAEGTCVTALCQTQGQGRSGRKFFSPDGGNLYMSLLLRPHDDLKTRMITVAAAVAVTEAIYESFNVNARIKWVNDIIYRNKKVCGIVAQAHNYGLDNMYVVLGIGINIYPAKDVPPDLEGIYGSIIQTACDVPKDQQKAMTRKLAGLVISRFSKYYEQPKDTCLIDKYRDYSIVTGRIVEYMSGRDTIRAKAVGISDEGGIMLEHDGVVKTFSDGEIRIKLADM